MKHKKRDRLLADEKLSEYERHQNDHEQFLQTFEKPTQIYRYISTLHKESPIFLHRNLSYMRGRMSRRNRKRTNFILEKFKESVIKSKQTGSENRLENLQVDFKGVFTNGNELHESAEIEIFLIQATHSRRKSQTNRKGMKSAITETKVGSVTVPLNPKDKCKPATVTIHNNQMNLQNGCSTKGFSLLFRVKVTPSSALKSESKSMTAVPNGVINGHVTSDTDDEAEDQPAKKKRKTRSCNVKNNTSTDGNAQKVLYDSELTVYDNKQQKVLSNGQYDVLLYDAGIERGDIKQDYCPVKIESKTFDAFSLNPVMKFDVSWVCNLSTKDLQLDQLLSSPNVVITPTKTQGTTTSISSSTAPPSTTEANNNFTAAGAALSATNPASQGQQRIFYHFLYNHKTRQQTEARTDMHCPWCLLNCCSLYPLLKHLRNCHARFNFTYYDHPKGARIDVSINEGYDGSYVGNPLDLQSHIGYCFGRLGPVRRTPVTQLLVYKPKKPSFQLSEFMEPETEVVQPRNSMHGHNRLYNHTITLQPIRPSEMENDSEDELDPDWLRQKTVNLIDEFTDVNEGEKEIMKMWNIHIMTHNFIGDCLVPKACTMFIQEYGPEIIQRNLCRNLIVHLTNLCDFGLVKPDMVRKTTIQLFRLRAKMFSDGLLYSKTPVHVNKKWDPLRNYAAVPIVTADCDAAPKLVPENSVKGCNMHSSFGTGSSLT